MSDRSESIALVEAPAPAAEGKATWLPRRRHAPRFTPAVATLAGLLSADLFFVAGHLALVAGVSSDPLWMLERDDGYAERYQHQKFLATAIVLALWAAWERRPTLLAWAATFCLLWADDKYMLHEFFGLRVRDWTQRYAWLQSVAGDGTSIATPLGAVGIKHVGELLFAAALGLIVLGLIAITWRNGGRKFRHLSRRLIAAVLLLGFCGIAIDQLDALGSVSEARWLGHRLPYHLLTLLEDGDELLAASLAAYFVVAALPPRKPAQRAESTT